MSSKRSNVSAIFELSTDTEVVMPIELRNTPAALVVAHPGHELRLYGWLQLATPWVFVLTDGSGHTGKSRLGSTYGLLAQTEAQPAHIFGRFTDRDIYNALLHHELDSICRLAEELSENFVKKQIRYVVGDAIEGYNPVHDVCRLLINAAVKLANRRVEKAIANFDFLLKGRPDVCSGGLQEQAIRLNLNAKTFEQKLLAARAYEELRKDVEQTFGEFGTEAFQTEYLRPVATDARKEWFVDEPPFYERYGEKQVKAGYYQQVLRFREHILPLIEALQPNDW